MSRPDRNAPPPPGPANPPDSADSTETSASSQTLHHDGESRYRRPPSGPSPGGRRAAQREIDVLVPATPPALTPGAARVLLRILQTAQQRKGPVSDSSSDIGDTTHD